MGDIIHPMEKLGLARRLTSKDKNMRPLEAKRSDSMILKSPKST